MMWALLRGAMNRERESTQFIQVEFLDGSFGAMAPAALDLCLRQKRIRSFRRSDGWVVVGLDPLRRASTRNYAGPERRSPHQSADRNSTRLS